MRAPGEAVGTLPLDSAINELAANAMGMGSVTAQTMVAAERLGLPLERLKPNQGDSSLPGNILAGASSQAVTLDKLI